LLKIDLLLLDGELVIKFFQLIPKFDQLALQIVSLLARHLLCVGYVAEQL